MIIYRCDGGCEVEGEALKAFVVDTGRHLRTIHLCPSCLSNFVRENWEKMEKRGER